MTAPDPVGGAICPCGRDLDIARADVSKVYAWGRCAFYRCRSCGSFVQYPPLSRELLAAWFSSPEYRGGGGVRGSIYSDYDADEANRRVEAAGRCARDILPFLPAGSRVLEIGCATGSLLASLRDAGMIVRGVDLSEEFAARARSANGIDVVAGDFLDMPDDGTRYDAVLMLGTISNIQKIGESLKKIFSILNDDGLLFFNFPNSDSYVSRLYGDKFWMYAPSVACFFSRRVCIDALARAGFAVSRMRIDRQQPSIDKLLHHAHLDAVLTVARRLGINHRALPLPFPVPGVYAVWARKKGKLKFVRSRTGGGGRVA